MRLSFSSNSQPAGFSRRGQLRSFDDTRRGYLVTDRSLTGVSNYYPYSFLNIPALAGKRVLDIGAGNSTFAAELQKAGIEAYGVDLEHFRGKPHQIRGAAEELPFADERFDAIYSTFSLFHYDEMEAVQLAALKEIERVLKPGGRFVTAPTYEWLIKDLLDKLDGTRLEISRTGFSVDDKDVVELIKR